jgi:hypothetical protein
VNLVNSSSTLFSCQVVPQLSLCIQEDPNNPSSLCYTVCSPIGSTAVSLPNVSRKLNRAAGYGILHQVFVLYDTIIRSITFSSLPPPPPPPNLYRAV